MKKFVIGTVVLLLMVFPSRTFAGGGPIFISVDGEGSQTPNLRIVRVFLAPSIPCKNSAITFKFNQPASGDSITVGSSSQTYIMPEEARDELVHGLLTKNCSTYAKTFSGVIGDRLLDIEVKTPDNQVFDRQIVAHYDGKDYGYGIDDNLPWLNQTVSNIINVSPKPSISPSTQTNISENFSTTITASGSSDIKNLQDKVDKLEQQTNQTSKKQNQLERILQKITSFLHSIFPVFKD